MQPARTRRGDDADSIAGCRCAFGLALRGAYTLDPQADDGNLLVLGYGGVKDNELDEAVLRLKALHDHCCR